MKRWEHIPEPERKRRLAERFAGMAKVAARAGRRSDAAAYRRAARECEAEVAPVKIITEEAGR